MLEARPPCGAVTVLKTCSMSSVFWKQHVTLHVAIAASLWHLRVTAQLGQSEKKAWWGRARTPCGWPLSPGVSTTLTLKTERQ